MQPSACTASRLSGNLTFSTRCGEFSLSAVHSKFKGTLDLRATNAPTLCCRVGEQMLQHRRTIKVLFCYAIAPPHGYIVGHSLLRRRSQKEQVYETEPYFYYGTTGSLLVISFGLLFPNVRRSQQRAKDRIQMNANVEGNS